MKSLALLVLLLMLLLLLHQLLLLLLLVLLVFFDYGGHGLGLCVADLGQVDLVRFQAFAPSQDLVYICVIRCFFLVEDLGRGQALLLIVNHNAFSLLLLVYLFLDELGVQILEGLF